MAEFLPKLTISLQRRSTWASVPPSVAILAREWTHRQLLQRHSRRARVRQAWLIQTPYHIFVSWARIALLGAHEWERYPRIMGEYQTIDIWIWDLGTLVVSVALRLLLSLRVCNQLFIDRYMWPEGPWQRLAAALADSSGVLLDHILSQI